MGMVAGLAGTLLLSVFAIAQYALTAGGAFDAIGISLSTTLAVYICGGIVGGLIVGLLLPITTWRWGSVLVGIIAFMPLYIGVDVLLDEADIYTGIASAVFMGGLLGYGMWHPVRQ